jgi:hypothetical protein
MPRKHWLAAPGKRFEELGTPERKKKRAFKIKN